MFSLLSKLWGYYFAKAEASVLILGLDHAGKTSFLEQVKRIYSTQLPMPMSMIPPTVGLNVAKIDVHGVMLTFWDVGGQVKLRTLWDRYYADAQGLIYIIDSADVERFEEASLAFEAVKEQVHYHAIPILLVANKQDLLDACGVVEIEQQFHADRIQQGVLFSIQPMCTANGDGVSAGIQWLVKALEKHY